MQCICAASRRHKPASIQQRRAADAQAFATAGPPRETGTQETGARENGVQAAARNPVSAAALAATTCDRPRTHTTGRPVASLGSAPGVVQRRSRTGRSPAAGNAGGLMQVDW